MSEITTIDLDVLNQARNRVLYTNEGEEPYTNSLVSWTLSEKWTTPTIGQGGKRGELIFVSSPGNTLTRPFNEVSGEILNAR